MRRLLSYGDRYLQRSDWRDIGVIKACVFSIGVFFGTYIPKKKTECVRMIALAVFMITAVSIMIKFFQVVTDKGE